MSDDVDKVVEGILKRGLGFRAGDVVVIEAIYPVSQATAEVLATYFGELYEITGVRFVLLDYGLKVSEVHKYAAPPTTESEHE